MQHRGEIIENVVRRSGISLSVLAERMGISRNTLYNRFKEKNLSYDFILTLGMVLHYNFAVHFPEIKSDSALPEDARAELFQLEQKYKTLLEKYHWLLKFLLKKSQDADQHGLHKKIKELINSSF
ncbi:MULTISPECIES: helix-turn-helix domain-containing protein [Candidatus Cardinium]|uniref:helix-turn-helix domain-containing protein n=1 Tax=Candidatus Cardinium TaxID=273135 RepID=UPI001FAB355F|nr:MULTISPECIES: helix-turn-helix domain-containing protein [Cardinium]